MNNLEIILQLLYKKVPAQSVLEDRIQYNHFSTQEFLNLAVSYMTSHSENEAQNILSYYLDTFRERAYMERRNASNILNVFDALFYYADDCLTIQNNEVLCKYNRLLYWRQMTLEISEELIVAAYFAQKISAEQMKYRGFSWKRVIGHNNIQLNQLIKRGISENHFHLNGSAPIFHISWLSLMNNVVSSKFAGHLKEYDKNRRYTNKIYSNNYKEESFYFRYLQAALIRILLYSKIANKRIRLGSYYFSPDEVINCLNLPEFWVNSEAKYLSKSEIYTCVSENMKEEENFGLYFWSCYTKGKSDDEGELQKAFREVSQNQTYLKILRNTSISQTIYKSKFLTILEKCNEQVSIKQLMEMLILSTKEIEVQDMPIEIFNYKVFCSVWNKKTWRNAKKLLRDPKQMEIHLEEVQSIIDGFRFVSPGQGEEQEMDYLLRETDRSGIEKEEPYFIFSGERWLLYTMLCQIYSDRKGWEEYNNLFYAYILLKESIRSELVQVNRNVGFRNFQVYQNRKSDLLQDAIYRNMMAKHALRESFITENIRTIEIRISPADCVQELRRRILELDNLIDFSCRLRHQFFYTVHFIKRPDKDTFNEIETRCRHWENRERYQRQMQVILDLREKCPLIGGRILGIDAASNEIGCRPEVFGEIFRYLKNQSVVYLDIDGKHRLPQIRATYHVGEDFLDVADGLRAIDEAIRFLNLDCGDRLGHALALGINVEQWYKGKGYRIVLPEQDYLDNIVWIHQRLRRYRIPGFDNLRDFIQKEFNKIFERIYTVNMNKAEMEAVVQRANKEYGRRTKERAEKIQFNFNMYQYYSAWKLRGDAPQLYKMGYFDENMLHMDGRKEKVNKNVKRELRYSAETCLLYYYYHFHPGVRRNGQKTIQVKVEQEYILAVSAIQKKMQQEIAKKGLAIETNPSSNYLIGTFKSYENHPIINFYNKDLTIDFEELKECAQIPVSINTDDQGVFSTSLENEYALMARALEKVKNDTGETKYQRARIYDWLDAVRIQGNEQSFGYQIYEEHKRGSTKKREEEYGLENYKR